MVKSQDVVAQFKLQGWAEVRTKDCYLTIEQRPPYCDRGRYVVKVTVTSPPDKLFIDGADAFPRYYFGFDAMISEINAWLKARDQTDPPEWEHIRLEDSTKFREVQAMYATSEERAHGARNSYGLVMSRNIKTGEVLPVICGHGGSMWLCVECAEQMCPRLQTAN